MSVEKALGILKDKTQAPKVRLDATLLILDDFKPEYLSVFKKILEDATDHPDVRSGIALGLGKVGKNLVVEDDQENPALEILLPHADSPDVTVRNYALQGLGMLGHESAIPALIHALKDENNLVFNSAAQALGQLGRSAVEPLVNLLNEGAPDARCVAAWKLGELRYIEAIPHLVHVLQHDDNVDLLALATWGLGEIGYGTDEVIEALTQAKAHEDKAVSVRAHWAILKIARHNN